MKKCSRCNLILSPAEFNRKASSPDGLQSYCRECQRQKFASYYQADPDKQRQRRRDYYAAHPEEQREARRAYYEANVDEERARAMRYRAVVDPELRRRWGREHYARHRVQRIQQAAGYSARHPDRVHGYKRKWDKANPLKRREIKHRRRAREYATRVDPIDYAAIYHRDKGICHICHNPTPKDRLHFDHVIPLARGGTHTEGNIKVAHARCNLRKGATV
jgi:5-methylcytosine-specific restriction endonuclease McrA